MSQNTSPKTNHVRVSFNKYVSGFFFPSLNGTNLMAEAQTQAEFGSKTEARAGTEASERLID